MNFKIHQSHHLVFWIPALLYIVLVVVVAIIPAIDASNLESESPVPEVTPLAKRGRELFLSFNCVCCHTQQIRGDWAKRYETRDGPVTPVLKPDAIFALQRASEGADYNYQDPPLMGTQRTGPDLTNVGARLPGAQWHYWHLYDPRSVSPDSLMPSYRFLFTTKEPPADQAKDYEKVEIIDGLNVKGGTLWATPDAKAMVEYLLSLRRQADVDEGGAPAANNTTPTQNNVNDSKKDTPKKEEK